MSRVVIQGDASGTGNFTIAAPNSNTDRTLTLPDAGGTLDRLDRAGNFLQIVSTTKTDVGSFASANTNNYVDIPGMSVTITPTSTSSKILVTYTAYVSNSTTATVHVRLYRDSTSIGQGNAESNRLGDSSIFRPAATPYGLDIGCVSNLFLDAPNTTSAVTYKLQGTLGATYNGTFYINRSPNDATNQNYVGRVASTITVMEIAG